MYTNPQPLTKQSWQSSVTKTTEDKKIQNSPITIESDTESTEANSEDLSSYKKPLWGNLIATVMKSQSTERGSDSSTNMVQKRGLELRVPPSVTPVPEKPQLMRSPQNPIQLKCSACETEEKEELKDAKIQTKLTVGAVGDSYEQEADRVARRVISISDQSLPMENSGGNNSLIQRAFQAPSITPVVQKLAQDSPLQRAFVVHRQVDEQMEMKPLLVQRAFQARENQADGDIENRLNASKGGGSPLNSNVRSFMEPRFGADFSQVRVHTGSEAVQMSQELNAQAFTHGSDVYFGQGKSPGNNELTAHELTHVV
jgi:hypothetical protein